MPNVNGPSLLTLKSSTPLSCNTTVPDNPETVPPIEYVGSGGGADPVPPAQLSAVAAPKVIRPGAPPVRVLSVAAMRWIPFCWNEIVEPTALSVSWVPAGRGPLS